LRFLAKNQGTFSLNLAKNLGSFFLNLAIFQTKSAILTQKVRRFDSFYAIKYEQG
jgi:hypothetical protein